MHEYPTHQSVLAFDVEGFSDPYRDNTAQTEVRAALYRIVQDAFASAGVPWQDCVHEDRGDGAIVIIPADVSKVLLLDPLPGCLSAGLTEHNRRARLAERIRLRMALHAGEVGRDQHGLSGIDVTLACRLLDAEELKSALRHCPAPLALVVSDTVYDGIVRHGYRGIDPATYHPVTTQVKKNRLHAWIHLPGVPTPPVIDTAPAAADEPPRQLRPAVATFVNRDRELRMIDSAGNLVVLVGPPGVGKTAFAVHWANRVRDRYDGGQLYADLGGPGGQVALEQVLGRFLRSLGVAAQRVPVDADEQAMMFRSLTAGRTMLVLLDNVASAAQVRALQPASPSSVTVVTSRAHLGGLVAEGARFIPVDRLSQTDGVELLARSVGPDRITAEAGPAAELVALCGGLPIALCVIGARLVSRPRWTVAKVVADLLDERGRLTWLTLTDDLSVKAVFDVSYQALSEPAARLYRLLGLHPGPDFDAGLAAAALAAPLADAERLLDELLTANLLEEQQTGRYRFHDLIRLHAHEQAEAEESRPARLAGVRRMLDWYLDTATEAGQVVTPHRKNLRRDVEHAPLSRVSFADHTQALDWLDRERVNLLAAARYALEHGLQRMAWQLADAMWGLFLFRTHYHDWMQFDLIAVEATQRDDDPAAQAEAQDRLGLLFHALGRNDEALGHMRRAAALWRELGERHRIASSTERFGFAYLDMGQAGLAIEHFTQALAAYRDLGEQRSVGLALVSLGRALIDADRHGEAVTRLRAGHETLATLDVPDPYNVARALIAWGRAETRAGTRDGAQGRLEEALAAMRSMASPLGEADALWALAELCEHHGDLTQALRYYEMAEPILADLGNPGVTRVRERIDALAH